MPPPEQLLPEPWLSFLNELDQQLDEPVELHCMGGFAVVHAYGFLRDTQDIDVMAVVPYGSSNRLVELAGKSSPLQLKYRIYIDGVTISTAPDEYETRLRPLFPSSWVHLRLFALEAHDLALSKLERNSSKDQDDVKYLAQAGLLDAATLRQRYYEEMQPYVIGQVAWHDRTLEIWIEEYLPSAP